MPTKSAAHLKKVDHALWVLLRALGISVRKAMILARFSKKDITNKFICRMIGCHLLFGGHSKEGFSGNSCH